MEKKEKKFWAVVGTEENMYEPQVEEFSTKQKADRFCDKFETECEEEGYDSYIAGVAESEQGRDELVAEIQQYRRDEIKEKFGEDVGENG